MVMAKSQKINVEKEGAPCLYYIRRWRAGMDLDWNGIPVKNVATGTVFQSKCGRFSIILYLFHTSLRLFAVNFAVVTLHAKLRLSVL